jgi:DNA-binding CsgD family transcriptional regulator
MSRIATVKTTVTTNAQLLNFGNMEKLAQPTLTRRETEVLKLLAQGLSSKEIAYKFNIDSKTVDVHRAIIRKKLGIFSTPGLVKYALRMGLVGLDD